VVAPHRVMTNAHVVAGSTGITVQLGGSGPAFPGRLVVYDPERDLAVIDVPALSTSPLPLGAELTAGTDAVVAGYPGNGPYSVAPARVRQVIDASGTDIYRKQTVLREVYSLRGIVRPGNSGGPLFDDSGRVVGVVFARSSVDANTGYALTADEIAPVVAAAGSTTPVGSGQCAVE
jgi:S1-C subfamily serine protease